MSNPSPLWFEGSPLYALTHEAVCTHKEWIQIQEFFFEKYRDFEVVRASEVDFSSIDMEAVVMYLDENEEIEPSSDAEKILVHQLKK